MKFATCNFGWDWRKKVGIKLIDRKAAGAQEKKMLKKVKEWKHATKQKKKKVLKSTKLGPENKNRDSS